MYRILIVDDELPVASGIAHIMKRDFSGIYELAGIANSGREAVEKAIRAAPDIVLMDVKMPGFSGLEAIREIKIKGVNPAFIMITAYERFEIAREALELGVVDYLLKPVAAEALAFSMKRAEKFLENRDKLEKTSLELHEIKDAARTLAEQNLIFSMVMGTLNQDNAQQLKMLLELKNDAGIACAIYASPETLAEIQHEMQYKTDIIAEKISPALLAAFIPVKNSDSREAIENTLGELEDMLKNKSGVMWGYGVPCMIPSLSESWDTAISNLNHHEGKSGRADSAWKHLFAQLENELSESLLTGSTERILPFIQQLHACARNFGLPSESEIGVLISLVGRITRELLERSCLSDENADSILKMKSLYAASQADIFVIEAERKISNILQYIEKAPGRYSRNVAEALSIIHDNYAKPLSLESVADAIGISPGRLSRLFVEEIGQGFSRYLVMFRIKQAKIMLERPNASVKAVSVACGYPDQNYFARLFKKVSGTTPTAYMTECSKKSGGAHETRN